MSAMTMPVLYRQSVEDELAVDQFREQACREQLCISHTLASNGSLGNANYAALHRQDGTKNGNTEIGELIRERHGIQVGSSPCKGFSMRCYVANVREVNFGKCWPFRPHLLERRLEENADALLPPLKVLTYRYWECSECADNGIHADGLVQRTNGEEFDVSKHHAAIKCCGNPLSRLAQDEILHCGDIQNSRPVIKSLDNLKEDGTDQKVTQQVSIYIKPEEPYFLNDKEIFHDRDDVVENNAMGLLKLQKASSDLEGSKGNHPFSVNGTIACNATLWPTDSELTSSATQSFCSEGNDEAFVDQDMNQITSELVISNFAEKAEALPHMSRTIDSSTPFNQVENFSHKSHDDIIAKKELKQFIMETPANSTLTATTVDIVHKQVHVTHMSTRVENNVVLSKVNKYRAKRQKGKGKALKKRLISDLIGDTPFEELRFNEVNWNHTVKHTTRKAKIGIQGRKMIGKWRVSKAAAYNLRKFKGKIKYASKDFDKQQFESMGIKSKCQRPGVSYQSSASAKTVEEITSPVRRRYVSKTSEGPHNERLSSGVSRKDICVTMQTKSKRHMDQDDDLLIDLASFMAQNQFERNATLPSSISLQEKGCVRGFVMGKKNLEAEDFDHAMTRKSELLSDPTQLHTNDSSKQDLPKEQNASRCISSKYALEDGQVHSLVEDGHQQLNQMQESLLPEKLDISGQGKEAGGISKTWDVNVSGSIYPPKITETVERNLDKHGDACSVSHVGNLPNAVVTKGQYDNNIRTFQRKRPAINKSIKQLQELVKSSCNQLSLIENANAALKAALLDGKPRKLVSVSTTMQDCDDGPEGSPFSNSGKATVSGPARTDTRTCFAPAQTAEGAGFAPVQASSQHNVSPTYQIRPLNSQVILAFANSESSNAKAGHLNQTGGCPKEEKTDTTPTAGCDLEVGALQPIIREEEFSGNPLVRSEGRDFVVESSTGLGQGAKDEGIQKQGLCLEPPLSASTFPVSSGCAPQLSATIKGLPVKNFLLENRSQYLLNSHGYCPLLAGVPLYFTSSAPSSLVVNPMAEYAKCNHTQPLRSSLILSFAQGNKLDTETALSQESFAQGKFDLQAYIQERIKNFHPGKASEAKAWKRSAASDAKEGTRKRLKASYNPSGGSKPDERLSEQVSSEENEKTQIANVQDSEVCTLNQNPAEVTELGKGLPTKRSVGTCQKVVQLPMDANGQNQKSKKNVKAKQVQPEGQNMQPVILPPFQIHTPRKNTESASKKTLKSDKLNDPNELKKTLPTNMPVANRRKYVKKKGKELTGVKNKLEVRSHSMQNLFDLRAIENYIMHGKFCITLSSQDLPLKGEEPVKVDAGCKHVLKPIAQNTQQCLPIHSSIDQCGKFVNTLDRPLNTGHPIANATENNMDGARSGTSTIAIPASVAERGPSTIECLDVKPENVRPFGAVLKDGMQIHNEKPNAAGSVILADEEVHVMNDDPQEPIFYSQLGGVSEENQKQRSDVEAISNTLDNNPFLLLEYLKLKRL